MAGVAPPRDSRRRPTFPAMAPPSLDLIRSTRGTLLRFYDTRRRALPWRAQPEPYGVWISEVMLQQTRVDAVLPYYRAWMERFPDLATLAGAGVDDVLRAWEGLGYYARARNLHRAALMVRDRFGGELPASAAGLRELPRVGEYTAGAVASIAYGEVVSAVDGNVRRVMARLFDEREPTTSWLRERAGALVDPERPGDFNQALMDLGATVCTARAPVCGVCPLAPDCLAAGAARWLSAPVRADAHRFRWSRWGWLSCFGSARAPASNCCLPAGLRMGCWEAFGSYQARP